MKPEDKSLEYAKIIALTNLMKIDGISDKSEKDFIQEYVQQIGFDQATIADLNNKIDSSESYDVNIELIKNDFSEAKALLILLVALSNEDGEFHDLEKKYIRNIGAQLGFAPTEVESIITQKF